MSTPTFRLFTDSDFMSFAGADGTDPHLAETEGTVVIVDRDNVEVLVDGIETRCWANHGADLSATRRTYAAVRLGNFVQELCEEAVERKDSGWLQAMLARLGFNEIVIG